MFPLIGGVTPRGEKIQLRAFEEAEAEELFEVSRQNRGELREWLPSVDWANSVEDSREFIRAARGRFDRGSGFSAGIWVGPRLCGAISLHGIDARHRSTNLGYWLARDARGSGLMTQSCAAVVTSALHFYRLHRIEIRCATANARSCSVAERLGFVREGVLREAEWLYDHFVDLTVYSILEHEWAAVRQQPRET